ncbi:hypothetical protein J2T07_002519 [Luteibacter jiangsuensis]|uniref:DUF4189 domain-containing protein n=1 Tax=Luteibacter jiangsuensis TaxID=637577 RepID=A0ABT9T0K8_9GAMM|nr:DUF4189 domain-containing protein [Luteibacter jiangsuensis]MDQ0010329.1 hypothetical protein [Luteibacter jiangsuensis]
MKLALNALLATALASSPAFALQETPISAPAEVEALSPTGMHLIFFKTSGDQPDADAAAVFETNSGDRDSRQRELILLRKKDGRFHEVDRNDKIIGCTTCDQFRQDPFLDRHITVTPGHISILHTDSGEKESTAEYQLVYDSGISHWRITSAKRTDFELGQGNGVSQAIPLPSSGLMKDFDAKWKARSFWTAIVVNDVSHQFHFVSSVPSERELDVTMNRRCNDPSTCRILVKQQDGCVALVQDELKNFFASALPLKRSEAQAEGKAMSECKLHGHGTCTPIRTGCTLGSR